MEDDAAVLALFDEIGQVLGAEGRVAHSSVYVMTPMDHMSTGLPWALLEHHLGCGVAEGASHGRQHLVLRVEHLAMPKSASTSGESGAGVW